MAKLKLRPATIDDADAIRALSRTAYAKWVPLIGREPRPMTADYHEAIATHEFALHERDNELVALIELEPRPDHLLIVNIAVSPEVQHQGIGGKLLAHAEDRARSLGLGELRLYTNAKMITNIALYEHFGYAEFDRDPMPGGTDIVHMRKRLSR
jgi:N-acetylglutamate synthase-like GNAT family acetyltransferase